MCGIFGLVSDRNVPSKVLYSLMKSAFSRGRDSSGIAYLEEGAYNIVRSDESILGLASRLSIKTKAIIGHGRLITNGEGDNQPVRRGNLIAIHNGIIVNDKAIWKDIGLNPSLDIDSEAILGLTERFIQDSGSLDRLPTYILERCAGAVSAAVVLIDKGLVCLFSNTGSLFYGEVDGCWGFSSEEYVLKENKFVNIVQVGEEGILLDIPRGKKIIVKDYKKRSGKLTSCLPEASGGEEERLIYRDYQLKRCSKCILPETMPYIEFDDDGVCNYCKNYVSRNKPRPLIDFERIVDRYRRTSGAECIVPFSGGRDSCWSLHLICKEMGLRPITYTYDWGMVTDLARRNISRMSAALGVENIIIAADIVKKRRNIALNLQAWLKNPSLGMVSILTAGDKHFFQHINTVKKRTGIGLNLWGINPLETTHFKSGFLGIKPKFLSGQVYSSGSADQIKYQSLRLKEMCRNPAYFNRSLYDTISGEYYRSISAKEDYYHVFDYWKWEEDECNNVLSEYGWETSPDTTCTWRIGDGTAAFYNYVYYTVAGFTEHDTFRSNQIREGDISRAEALKLVRDENQPRYQNIRWYLDLLGFDFREVINVINNIPPIAENRKDSRLAKEAAQ